MLDTNFNSIDFIFIDDKEMLRAVKDDLKGRCKILEVLTHEQFEANCYKAKGDEVCNEPNQKARNTIE